MTSAASQSSSASQHSYVDTKLLIGTQWLEASDGKTLPVVNPATGHPIGKVACASKLDLDAALEAALKGFDVWRWTPAHERTAVMRRASGLLRQRVDAIAGLLTQEQGKPLAESRVEVLAGADIIDWFADEGQRTYGRVVPPRNLAAQQLVLKEPVGPVAAFTPWNFPVNQIVRKLGAALATGCSFLCKAPEETPASPAALFQCFVDAGAPPGVVGLVFGNPAEVSSHLVSSPIIRKVTFTGSTQVGKHLAALAGTHMKRVTMELGGHAPVVVAQDADLELAVKACFAAKFRNAGQVCISPSRFLVHRSLAGDFVDMFTQLSQGLTLGDGLAATTTLGPLANPRRLTAMSDLVRDAAAKGARVATGGGKGGEGGYFFAPTVLADVPLDARIFNEEPFGPVAAVHAFDHLDEALAESNRLPYGLAGYAFTRSLSASHLLAQRMEVGMLWINQPAVPLANMPFGGVKDSGYGSEGGPEALEAYLVSKSVSILAS